QLLFFSASDRTSGSPAVLPILQKNQFAALARFVLVMCGALSCFYYGVLPGFYSCCVCNKAFAVPAFKLSFKSMGYGFTRKVGRGVSGDSLPYAPFKCYPSPKRGNSSREDDR